jgi:hypothetical protein
VRVLGVVVVTVLVLAFLGVVAVAGLTVYRLWTATDQPEK